MIILAQDNIAPIPFLEQNSVVRESINEPFLIIKISKQGDYLL